MSDGGTTRDWTPATKWLMGIVAVMLTGGAVAFGANVTGGLEKLNENVALMGTDVAVLKSKFDVVMDRDLMTRDEIKALVALEIGRAPFPWLKDKDAILARLAALEQQIRLNQREIEALQRAAGNGK